MVSNMKKMKLEVSKRVVVRDVILNGEDREVLNKVTFEQRHERVKESSHLKEIFRKKEK